MPTDTERLDWLLTTPKLEIRIVGLTDFGYRLTEFGLREAIDYCMLEDAAMIATPPEPGAGRDEVTNDD